MTNDYTSLPHSKRLQELGSNCHECGESIKGEPYSPEWMLGYKFCNEECAQKNYNNHRDKLVLDISKILSL